MSDFLNVPRRNHASDEKAASSPVLADTNDSARNETVPKKRGGRNPRSKYWTDAERQLLLQRHKALFPAFEKHEEKLFEKIAVCMPGRTGSACKQHYKNVLMKKREAPAPKTKKHTRTAGIDAASHLESDDSGAPRTKRPKTEAGHGCKRGRWGDDEKRTFDELFSEFGTVWSKYEGRIPGRNAVSCKTHYNKTYQCLKNANADADASGDISDGGDTSGFVSENHHSEEAAFKKNDLLLELVALSAAVPDKEAAALAAKQFCKDKKYEKQVEDMIVDIQDCETLEEATIAFCDKAAAVMKSLNKYKSG